MSESNSKPPAPISPPRPIHRINRSITEVSPPTLKIHRPHHLHNSSHHHHYHNTRRARSSDKERNTQTPQSAHPNLQPFIAGTEARWRDGVKSEFGTPAESRRASGTMWDPELGNTTGGLLERRYIKEGEVKEERERGLLRSTELRSSLISLNALSNDQTSKLDITYYSVLEKLAFFQSSLASLKEVASATRKVNTDFQSESSELVTEITEQIEAFSNFSSQENRIRNLTERVQTGRGKIKSLGERVDVIKRKVEGYERAEGAWQDKTRRRLRVMWIVMSVVAAVMIGLVFFRYTPAKTFGPGVIHGFNGTELRIPGVDGKMGNESVWSLKRETKEGEGMLDRLKKTQGERVDDDPRLRVFDEL